MQLRVFVSNTQRVLCCSGMFIVKSGAGTLAEDLSFRHIYLEINRLVGHVYAFNLS